MSGCVSPMLLPSGEQRRAPQASPEREGLFLVRDSEYLGIILLKEWTQEMR